MNFDSMNDAAAVAADVSAARGVGRLPSANRTSLRHSAAVLSNDDLSVDGNLQQQMHSVATPRSLLLYSRPSDPPLLSSELQHSMFSVPVSASPLADGARLVPFSVNSLRFSCLTRVPSLHISKLTLQAAALSMSSVT